MVFFVLQIVANVFVHDFVAMLLD